MNIKKTLRLLALVFFILVACILPFPLALTKRKDDLPKHLIEQVDTKTEDENDDIEREAFS